MAEQGGRRGSLSAFWYHGWLRQSGRAQTVHLFWAMRGYVWMKAWTPRVTCSCSRTTRPGLWLRS